MNGEALKGVRPRALSLYARGAILIAAATVALHAAVLNRYGYYGDELYFIECAKHLAWGYVDQPPAVALAAWLAAPFGYSLVALRALPALAAGLTVLTVYAAARKLGAGGGGALVAALAAAFTPAYLMLASLLSTTSFDAFLWTLMFYAVTRVLRGDGERWWILAAISAALAFLTKYEIVLPVATVLIALPLSPSVRCGSAAHAGGLQLFRTPWFWAAAALGAVMVAPNLLWEQMHGWPIFAVLQGDLANRHALANGMLFQSRDLLTNAAAFLGEQLIYTNPALAPLWLAGLGWLIFSRSGARFRAFGIAYVLTILAAVVVNGKGYYVVGFYGILLAAGAAAAEPLLRRPRIAQLAGAIVLVVSLPALPLTVPVLSLEHFIDYSAAIGMTGKTPAARHLVQPAYADEVEWNEIVAGIAKAYHALPPDVRARTTLYADTYEYASAINFYGGRYGLPRAISGQDTYWLWGYGDHDGTHVLLIGANQAGLMKTLYRNVRLVAVIEEPLRWQIEGSLPVYVCSDPVAPLADLWPRLRWYGG